MRLALALAVAGMPALADCPPPGDAPVWLQAACDIGEDTQGLAGRMAAERATWDESGEDPDPVLSFWVQDGGPHVLLLLGWDDYRRDLPEALDRLIVGRGGARLSPGEQLVLKLALELRRPDLSANAAALTALAPMAKERGLAILLLDMGNLEDAGVMVVTEDQFCRWADVRLAPGLALVPWRGEEALFAPGKDLADAPRACGIG